MIFDESSVEELLNRFVNVGTDGFCLTFLPGGRTKISSAITCPAAIVRASCSGLHAIRIHGNLPAQRDHAAHPILRDLDGLVTCGIERFSNRIRDVWRF